MNDNDMILSRKKAAELLFALGTFYKRKGMENIDFSFLSKDIIDRFSIVLIIDNGKRYLCNNPKYLKKFAMYEDTANDNPFLH